MSLHPDRPILWISHRGLKGSGVENTATAFQAATAAGFAALETDLRVTRDNHIVLIHDASLERLCGLKQDVSTMSREQLSAIKLSNGSKFLFLDEFIEGFPGCTWTFDIKPESGRKTIEVLIDWIRQRKFIDWFTAQARFLLWNSEQEDQLRQFLPEAKFYARSEMCWRAGLASLIGLPVAGKIRSRLTYSLPPQVFGLNLYKPPMIERFHARGAGVLAFLPKQTEEIEAAVAAGVDEILIDGPIPQQFAPKLGQSTMRS